MHLLKACTLLCISIVVVNLEGEVDLESEGESEVLQGGRTYKKKQHIKRRSKKHPSDEQSTEYPIMFYHDISTSLKGTVCSSYGECKHYGSLSSNVEVKQLGNPKWVMKVKKYRYFCFSGRVSLCPKFEGGKYKRYKGKSKPSKKKVHHYQMVYCGKIYVCYALKRRLCPHVPVVQTHWKKVTIEKVYVIEKGNLIIVCVASDIKRCQSIHGDEGWKERDDVPDMSGIEWSTVSDGIKYYCKATNIDDCLVTNGSSGSQWRKYCKGGNTEECFEERRWELRVGGTVIICVAASIEDCMKSHGGNWVPSNVTGGEGGGSLKPDKVPWVTQGSGGAKFYCDTNDPDSCPSVHGGRGWKDSSKDPDDSDGSGSEWEHKSKGITIVCVADDKDECKKFLSGKWTSSDRFRDEYGVPEDSRWMIDVGGGIEIYCDAKKAKSCPKLKKGGSKWKSITEGEPDDSEDSDKKRKWQLIIEGVLIVCVASDKEDCAEVHSGKWASCDRSSDEDGVPEKSRWKVEYGVGIEVYCDAKKAKSCPKLKKGGAKWKLVLYDSSSGDSKEPGKSGKWQIIVKGIFIVCVAEDVKACRKVFSGKWKTSHYEQDDDGVPEGMPWAVIVDGGDVYCGEENGKSCPKTKGGRKWGAVTVHDPPKYSGDGKEVDATVIVPDLVGGARYRQSQGDDTVLLCYTSKHSKGCPSGKKWIKTTKTKVGEKVHHIISVKQVWVKKVGDKHVVCVADEVKYCKPKGSGWVIIAGTKAGLWRGKIDGIDIYCEAEKEGNCPDDIDEWEVITKGGQWKQTKFDLKKKGDIWRLVTFQYTIYCDTRFSGKCPKIKEHHTWHKVFSTGIDFSSYGKKVYFESTIKKTLYACRAKNKYACPELPFGKSWTAVKKKFTIREIVEFFSDIIGFKDACKYNGVCGSKKYEPFSDKKFDRRSRTKPGRKKIKKRKPKPQMKKKNPKKKSNQRKKNISKKKT